MGHGIGMQGSGDGETRGHPFMDDAPVGTGLAPMAMAENYDAPFVQGLPNRNVDLASVRCGQFDPSRLDGRRDG